MTALLVALGMLDVDPPRSVVKPVEDRVRVILADGLGERLSEARLSAWTPRLALPVARVKSEERRARLLKELPDAVRFHLFMLQGVEDFLQAPGLAPFAMTKDEAAEGLEIQLAYLAARVDRAARRPAGADIRATVDAQIDLIMKTAAEALGPDARRTFDQLAAAWKGSFDMPYNTCLDRPLAEEDLREVLAKVRDVASTTTGAHAERVAAVREAAYLAVGRCFREFDGHQKRSDAWGEKRRKRHEDHLRANGVRIEK